MLYILPVHYFFFKGGEDWTAVQQQVPPAGFAFITEIVPNAIFVGDMDQCITP